jgi:hypothetical protein
MKVKVQFLEDFKTKMNDPERSLQERKLWKTALYASYVVAGAAVASLVMFFMILLF